MTQRANGRVTLAFFLGPLAPGLVILLCYTIYAVRSHSTVANLQFIGEFYSVAIVVMVGTAMIAYPAAVILGIPTYFLLKRLRLNRAITYFLVGLIPGAIYSVMMRPFLSHDPHVVLKAGKIQHQHSLFFFICTFMSISGGIAGIAFWLIGRPDLAAEKQNTA